MAHAAQQCPTKGHEKNDPGFQEVVKTWRQTYGTDSSVSLAGNLENNKIEMTTIEQHIAFCGMTSS